MLSNGSLLIKFQWPISLNVYSMNVRNWDTRRTNIETANSFSANELNSSF
jgi:hypothetical protein